jgi:DNA-binding transcriptional regulator YiaG
MFAKSAGSSGSQQFARKLCIPVATVRDWERGAGRTDPAMQTLLRILDQIPEPALRALAQPPRKAD